MPLVVRDIIKRLAQGMEARMREAAKRVASGDIPHLRQMKTNALAERATANLEQLLAVASGHRQATKAQIRNAAHDSCNYIAHLADRLEAEAPEEAQ